MRKPSTLGILLFALLMGTPSTLHAQSAGKPGEVKVNPTRVAKPKVDVRTNPLAYYVPEAWREKARLFLDPGPQGLEGGFVLRDLSLGHDVLATFEGPKGTLIVRMIPARVATADDWFKGQRVALRVIEDTTSSPKALAHLKRLVSEREEGWGWLRRDPKNAEHEAVAAGARKDVAAARRLLYIGDIKGGLGLVNDALGRAPNDALAHLMASRALYKVGRPTLGKAKAEAVLPTILKGLDVAGLDSDLKARTRLYVAGAKALAEDGAGALALALEVVKGPMACQATGVARTLRLVNQTAQAMSLIEAITKAAPSCDPAQALQVDLVRHTTSPRAALTKGEEITRARTGLALVRSARARAAIAAEELAIAAKQSAVPVELGGAPGESIIVLAAVLSQGGLSLAPVPKWQNMLERAKTTGNRGLNAAAYFAQGSAAEALPLLETLEAELPSAVGLKAMRALLLVSGGKLDEAKAALAAAWRSEEGVPWAVAAEAEVAEAEGRKDDATRIWQAYLDHLGAAEGPLSHEEAERRIAKLKGAPMAEPARTKVKAPAPETTDLSSSDTKAEEPALPLWVTLLGLSLGIILLWVWRRNA